jgi:hypothetical protein
MTKIVALGRLEPESYKDAMENILTILNKDPESSDSDGLWEPLLAFFGLQTRIPFWREYIQRQESRSTYPYEGQGPQT